MTKIQSLTLRNANQWFLIGSGLLNAIAFTFIVLSLTFISGYPLAPWHFPLGLLLSLFVNYFAARHFDASGYKPLFLRTTMVILFIILFSILIAGLFYDISFDGQMYHLESSLQMKAGWNPFKKELPPGLNQAIWLNHYGKGVEAPQAAIYALTNRIETTKATNFIILAASFCLSLGFFIRLDYFSFKKNLLFSTLLAFNPVSFYQLLSTYVDGQLCSYLLCLMAVACFLWFDMSRYYGMLLASILVVVINIKFTAIVFAAVFVFGLLFIFLLFKSRKTFFQLAMVCALAAVFAVVVVGYFPYVINTVEYHDPMYPGMKMLQSEAAKQTPDSFLHRNRFSKFVISFFSHTDDLHLYQDKNPVIPAKIPFTFNKTDIRNAAKPYVVHMSGFGPFFSGICIAAIVIFAVFFAGLKQRKEWIPVLLLLGTIIVSVFVISEAWFARYVPQLWFVPVILLIASEADQRKKLSRWRNLIYLIALVNISFCLVSFPYTYYRSELIRYELRQLKASGQTIPVQFTYYTSNRARFIENGIPFSETQLADSSSRFMVNSSTKYLSPDPLPDPPRPWILQLADRFSHGTRK